MVSGAKKQPRRCCFGRAFTISLRFDIVKMNLTISDISMMTGFEYAVAKGHVEPNVTESVEDWGKKQNKHVCRLCSSEISFDGLTILRPGRKDEKQVAVYRCFRCGNAEMEDI